jgi:hypothetical protein
MKTLLSLLLQKVDFLHQAFHPEWVDGGPGLPGPGPDFHTSVGDYAVATLIRDLADTLNDREQAAPLHAIANELAAEVGRSLANNFEDGDDICPPYRWPKKHKIDVAGPQPEPWVVDRLGPHPEPWIANATPAFQDALVANAVRHLASLTTNLRASNALKGTGEAIMNRAAGKLFDEYCGTPIKPRVPSPRPKTVAA